MKSKRGLPEGFDIKSLVEPTQSTPESVLQFKTMYGLYPRSVVRLPNDLAKRLKSLGQAGCLEMWETIEFLVEHYEKSIQQQTAKKAA